jgi:multimeric flavodoxin WrbA
MKALIDRAGFVGLANGRMYKNKIGAALSCFRRSGGMHTIETMNHFFFGNELIIAGRAMSVAREKGEVEKDAEGVQSAQALGQKIAWMAKKLYG